MPIHLIALFIGYILDLCFETSYFSYHPLCLMRSLIQTLEKKFRKWFPETEEGELIAGAFLTAAIIVISAGIGAVFLLLAYNWNPFAYLMFASLICYQMLATKSLRENSMKVYRELKAGDILKARETVSVIAGQDTSLLTKEDVAKVTVEVIAKNTSKGIIAPMFYMALFGPIGGIVYKAVNTMDSMIGYKNETYLYLGRTAARLDDVINFVPARLAAGLMIVACAFLKLPVKEAYRTFKRDRYAFPSPNAGQTEAVCAGALGVELSLTGTAKRQANCEDIVTANRLLYVTSYLGVVLFILAYWAGWNLLK